MGKARSGVISLTQIKALADALASVGSPIMIQEHMDSILEGLTPDYHLIIESKFERSNRAS